MQNSKTNQFQTFLKNTSFQNEIISWNYIFCVKFKKTPVKKKGLTHYKATRSWDRAARTTGPFAVLLEWGSRPDAWYLHFHVDTHDPFLEENLKEGVIRSDKKIRFDKKKMGASSINE